MPTLPAPTPPFTAALASGDHWLMVAICVPLVAVVVVLHYEALERLNRALPRLPLPHRAQLLVLMFALLAVHTLEIWLYGIGLYLATQWPGLGQIAGVDELALLDAVYLSTVTYTTVGYGDLTPQGPLRLLLGSEALSGFLLVTWSASFTYLEMQRNWTLDSGAGRTDRRQRRATPQAE
ncbi:MAG: potassium channel family protein [Pseudomonadota bacterium]